VKHYGSSDHHDGFDVSLSNDIVMVSAGARKSNYLFKLGQLGRERLGGKCGSVVGQE
jgi:hypothetical protein